MIVIGSKAAAIRKVQVPGEQADVDLVGTREELDEFRRANESFIRTERRKNENRIHFLLKPGQQWRKIEFDCEQAESDVMLAGLCTGESAKILNSTVYVPSVNVLYLTKRAHANVPVNFEKTVTHMRALKLHVTEFSPAEMAFYEARRKECMGRFEKNRPRFTLDVSNEEFFAVSNHIRTYVHDDMHKAIAFSKGTPIYENCKRDPTSARIERDMFLAMPREDQIRMVQEEFIVVGLERYFLQDRTLSAAQVYRAGMLKTVRDLFTGWFQDYCLDNIDRLAFLPRYDFLKRFTEAERNGELHLLEDKEHPDNDFDVARRLFSANRLKEARRRFLLVNEKAAEPGHVQALYYLGRIAQKTGNNEAASGYFDKVVKIDPKMFHAWNELGNVFRAKGKPRRAVECFRRAIRCQPGFAPAQVNLGRVLEERGEFRRAIEAYRRALRNNGDDHALRQHVQGLVERWRGEQTTV